MNKQQVLDFWIIFFKDLLVGTFKKIFLFGILGFLSGALGTYVFNFQVIDTAEWNVWLEVIILIIAGAGYLAFGLLHGWVSCSLHLLSKKMREALSGLQEFLNNQRFSCQF